ncbi:MAG: hypothetical protein QOJ29_834 [Thermoleophilaceae bacterium]|jgi:hypothetical protein|nr:hypothetical protein [Thermoleophilaceae bacterium]
MPVGILLACFAPAAPAVAQDPPNADARGDNGLVVNYAGAPGDCFVTCSLTARDELPADQAANVVSRQWQCKNLDPAGGGPNLASPASDSATTSCRLDKVGFYDIAVRRTYADGHWDLGEYQFSVIKKQDAEAPVVIAMPAKIKSSPAKVTVYTPKESVDLGWTSGLNPGVPNKAKGSGLLVRRSPRIDGGPHAGSYAYTLLVAAPRGKLLVKVYARNPTSDRDDYGEARSFVSKFRGKPFQVLQRSAGLDPAGRPAFSARQVVLSRPAVKWRTLLRVQERIGGRWGTFAQKRRSGEIGGFPGAQYDAEALEARSPLNKKARARIGRAMCAGRRYRVVGMFDIRNARGKQMLSAKQRTITRSLPHLAGGGC